MKWSLWLMNVKKSKSLALNSKSSSKALKAKIANPEEEASEEVLEDGSEDEKMTLLTKRFQHHLYLKVHGIPSKQEEDCSKLHRAMMPTLCHDEKINLKKTGA
jgi:hypothetical protein